MLRSGRFRRLFDGVHISSDQPVSLLVWLEASFLVLPPHTRVTHVTGLHARGVHVGSPWPLRLVTTSRGRVRRAGLHVTRAVALPPHTGRLASAEHCFASACADLDLVDAVTAGDWLLHLGHTTPARLRASVGGYHGPGAPMARRALTYVRERAESPRETYLRLLLVLAGLPEPKCNVDVGTSEEPLGRGDLVYDEYALMVEYDGRQHADDDAQWNRDLDRLDDFGDATWGHVRVTATRLRRPREVVARVHSRLVARGYAGPAPVFGTRWVALFETCTAADRARDAPDAESWTGPTAGTRPR